MTPKVVFVLVAIVCAFLALVGFPEGVESVKLAAAGVLAVAIAIVVP